MVIFSFPMFGLESVNLGGPESILLKFPLPRITNRFWTFVFVLFLFLFLVRKEQGVHSKTD